MSVSGMAGEGDLPAEIKHQEVKIYLIQDTPRPLIHSPMARVLTTSPTRGEVQTALNALVCS